MNNSRKQKLMTVFWRHHLAVLLMKDSKLTIVHAGWG